jgi:hypothetical protein
MQPGGWILMTRVTKTPVRICFLFFSVLFFYLHVPGASDDEPALFRLSDISGSLNLLYQVIDEEEASQGTVYRDSNRQYLEGGIHLISAGSIYHANLLSFNVDLNIAGHRSKNKLFSDAAVNNAINNTYDVRLLFFKEKRINIELYTKSNFSTHDRVFWERYFTTARSSGIRLYSRIDYLPFELEIYNLSIKSESLSYLERNEKSDNIDLRMPLLRNSRARLLFVLRNKNYSENVFNIHYKSLDLTGSFNYRYGHRDSNFLNLLTSYNRIKGNYDFEVFNFMAGNFYYFKPNLYLNTTYTLTIDNSLRRSYQRHDLYGELNHRLFESLNSELLLGGRLEDSPYQKIRAFRNQVNFYYKKKIPTGRILFRYSNLNEWSSYSSAEPGASSSDLLEFSYTDVVLVTQPGINRESIRITDPDFTYVYVEGIDYEIDILNNVITISRLPGGAIPRGGKVLVYYEYLTYPDFRLKLHSYNIDFRLIFLKYFHLIYGKRVVNNMVTSIYLVPPFESYDKDIYGTQFNSRFLNVDYTLESYDSNLSAYKSTNFRISGNVSLSRRFLLRANLTKSRIDFESVDYFSKFDAYSVESEYYLSNNSSANIIFRKIAYETPVYTRDRESILVKFRWTFRRIILDIYYEHILGLTDTYERGHNFFSLILRRTF